MRVDRDPLPVRLASLLVRGRAVWFAIGLIMVLIAGVYLIAFQPLKYNRSMEGFFPTSDPRLQLYLQNKEWFGGEFTLLIAYMDPDLWTPEGMRRQRRLVEALRNLHLVGVSGVNSLADSPVPRRPWQTVAEIIESEPALAPTIQREVQATPLYQGVFVAGDQQTTAVVVQLASSFSRTEDLTRCLEEVRAAAKAILGTAPPSRGGPAVAGTMLLIHDVYEYTEADGWRLQIASVVLMGLVIAVFFRSVRWVLLPFLVIYAALYWAESIWALWRGELTMVSSAISSLVAVIGVSTVVHFGMTYRELRHQYDTAKSLRLTYEQVGPPIFWVLATTAAGFGSLLICELKPVTDFAWLMVIATVMVGVATLLFLPLGIMGFRTREQLEIPGQNLLGRALLHSLVIVRRRPWLSAGCLILPGLLVGIGMLHLKPQTDFTRNFKEHTELFQAYDFIETNLGGAGQLDLVFDCPRLDSLSENELKEYLDRLRRLERELGDLKEADGSPLVGITKVLGLVDFFDFFEATLESLDKPVSAMAARAFPLTTRVQVLSGRVDDARKSLQDARGLLDGFAGRLLKPEQKERLKQQLANFEEQLSKFHQNPPAPHFWNAAAGKMRIMLQVRERLGTTAKEKLITTAQQKVAQVMESGSPPHATGVYVMLAHLIESILNDQRLTFALALLCMFTMGLLAFRSFWLAGIAMVPTVLPILVILGTMGWVGLPVNIATAMLASVAMGMTIDSSLLYIYRFNQEFRGGADFETALTRTHGSTGIALVVANIALVLGFGVLALSQFIPLVHFGLLTALALFGGMTGNLVLLPLLLYLVPGIRKSRMAVCPSAPEQQKDPNGVAAATRSRDEPQY